MNELQIFNYGDKAVRTVNVNGEIWWVLKDICEVFGEAHYRRVSQRIDEDEKGVTQIDTLGGAQNMTIISESGLYSALFSMQPEKARGVAEEYIAERQAQLRNFRRWVTHEVLPSIRKHGMYATKSKIKEMLANPDILIEALQALKNEQEKSAELHTIVNVQEQQIAELKPKAGYYDVVLACKDTVAITTIAKDYGKSGQWLNDYLHENGVQFKMNNTWLLYQKYAENGYTSTKTTPYTDSKGELHSATHTYWTQKGRLFLYELLKSSGVLPLVERNLEVV
jgi:prophage antirepressor-like protein